ncbi:MAG: amidohydrolase family protein [Myxococcota bacterium]|nr:amidohydrolase family protein [Myxococcota bacterium]
MAELVLQNASLFDPRERVLRPGTGVRVEGDRIVEVREGPLRHAGGVREVDLGGRVLLPGLIDCHVHVTITTLDLSAMARKPVTLVALEAARILGRMLRRGFTTVRDAGGADWGLATAVDRGLVAGPRIVYAGRTLSQTGGHGDHRPRSEEPGCACRIHTSGFAHVADGVAAVRRAAREELRRGASQIKIMASGGVASPSDPIDVVQYSAEEMAAAVEEAHAWHAYAMAHAYTPEAITRAVRAGVRTIEHGNLLDAETARLMAERGAILVPTLVTYRALDELGRKLGFPEVSQRKVQDVLDAGLASLERAREAGVPMGFGTDLLGEAHDQQGREFAIRAEALPPAEVLRQATLEGARILRREGELGEVVPDARADLVVVDGDPLQDPGLLGGAGGERLLAVMKDGELVVDRLGALA